MTFEDEFLREFQLFYEQNAHLYSNIDDALDDFVEIYNETMLSGLNDFDDLSPETQSYRVIEETINHAENEDEFIAGIHKALDIWPDNIEAKISLIHATAENTVTRIKRSEELLAKETVKWQKETDQVGWLAHEERPYLSLKHSLAIDYFENNMFDQAMIQFEEEMEINENDNLGARYYLAAIYANTNQWEKLNQFYHSNPYSENELLMVFPLLISAILKEDEHLASQLFEQLLDINDHVGTLLEDDFWPLSDIIAAKELDRYGVNSYEELCLACSYVFPLISSNMYVFDWLKLNDSQMRTADQNNILFPDFDNHSINQNTTNSSRKGLEFFTYANQEIFDGIKFDKVRILINRGLKTKKDFAKKTEKQVLAIHQIGPVTVKQLKENGVVFRKKK